MRLPPLPRPRQCLQHLALQPLGRLPGRNQRLRRMETARRPALRGLRQSPNLRAEPIRKRLPNPASRRVRRLRFPVRKERRKSTCRGSELVGKVLRSRPPHRKSSLICMARRDKSPARFCYLDRCERISTRSGEGHLQRACVSPQRGTSAPKPGMEDAWLMPLALLAYGYRAVASSCSGA